MDKKYILVRQDLNDDPIAGNEELKCVVKIIASLLNEKIQYFGDRGPLKYGQANYPDPNGETFVRVVKEFLDKQFKFSEMYNVQKLAEIIRRIENNIATIKNSDISQNQNSKFGDNNSDRISGKLDNILTALKNIKFPDNSERIINDLKTEIHSLPTDDENFGKLSQKLDQILADIKKIYIPDNSQKIIDALLEDNKTLKDDNKILKDMLTNLTAEIAMLKSYLEPEEGEDMKLLSRIKKCLTGIDDSHKERRRAIQTQLQNQSVASQRIESTVNSIKDTTSSIQSDLSAQNRKSNELQAELNTLNDKYKALEEARKSADEAAKKAYGEKEQLSRELGAKIEQLENTKTSNEQKIQRLEGELKTATESIQAVTEKSWELQKELDTVKNSTSGVTEKLEKLENENQVWENLTTIYKPVLESLQRCDTFRAVLDKNNIGGNIGASELFTIVTLIGRSIDFAKEIHNCALSVKQNNEEPISYAETEVYKALNSCYRKIWGIDFDIFVLPGGKSVGEEFTKIPFNKSEVIYMKNPRDKSSKYTQEVYVPLLKAQNGNIHTLAYVKAGNI